MRAITVIGEPGAGKSSLLRAVRARLSTPRVETWGLLEFERYTPERVLLLGRYADGDWCQGTDRLKIEGAAWLRLLLHHQRHLELTDWTVVWDGAFATDDDTILAARAQGDHTIVRLTACPATLAARRRDRAGRTLAEDFVGRRRAQVERTSGLWLPEEWPQETTADLATNTARVMRHIQGR